MHELQNLSGLSFDQSMNKTTYTFKSTKNSFNFPQVPKGVNIKINTTTERSGIKDLKRQFKTDYDKPWR